MSKFLAALKGYRTLIVNGIVMVAALLLGLHVLKMAPDTDTFGQAYDTLIAQFTGAIAAVNAILRLFTTTPAAKSE